MKPVKVIEGRMCPLYVPDVDTDQIMPKQFLKRTERTGYGDYLFFDWRRSQGFVLNDSQYRGSTVLVAGPNFGCGSSREHAPWGLQQYGFQAVVAPSVADIFRNNCHKNGLLTVELPAPVVERLAALARRHPASQIRVDLPQQTVEAEGVEETFEIEPHTKFMLTEGLDEIGLTLRAEADIRAYEERRAPWRTRHAGQREVRVNDR